jgi:hypothetical protein
MRFGVVFLGLLGGSTKTRCLQGALSRVTALRHMMRHFNHSDKG